jgi:large subunit ribosomal protein L6
VVSRIGKLPIDVPPEIKVSINGSIVKLEKHNQVKIYDVGNKVEVSFLNGQLWLKERTNTEASVVFSGLQRSKLYSLVYGLVRGFKTTLEYNGIGYRAVISGGFLVLGLGYSHDIAVRIPKNIGVSPEKPNLIVLESDDREALGDFAARLISLRPVEPYKGKGLKHKGQVVRLKEGKKK